MNRCYVMQSSLVLAISVLTDLDVFCESNIGPYFRDALAPTVKPTESNLQRQSRVEDMADKQDLVLDPAIRDWVFTSFCFLLSFSLPYTAHMANLVGRSQGVGRT